MWWGGCSGRCTSCLICSAHSSRHLPTATFPSAAGLRLQSSFGCPVVCAACAPPGVRLQVQVEPLSSPNEGISVISLSRSNAKNAIGRQLLRELQEAINTLRQERTTRCVLVRSTCPGTFCAGADLKVGRPALWALRLMVSAAGTGSCRQQQPVCARAGGRQPTDAGM